MSRARRRYPQARRRGLTNGIKTVLLVGWGGPAPAGLAPAPDEDPWLVFDVDLGALWRQYRTELMALARQHGIARPWAMTAFEDEE